RRILLVHPEEPWPLRHGPRHRARSVVRRTAGVVWRAAGRLSDRRFRAAAGPRSTIRLDHGVLYELLPLPSGKETLGNGRMGFFSARFAAPPGAGRKNLFWTQSPLQRRFLYASNTRSFSHPRRRGRARANLFRKRPALLTLAPREYNNCYSVRCPQRIFGIARPLTLRCGQRTLQAKVWPTALRAKFRGSDDVASADAALLFASAFDAVRQ